MGLPNGLSQKQNLNFAETQFKAAHIQYMLAMDACELTIGSETHHLISCTYCLRWEEQLSGKLLQEQWANLKPLKYTVQLTITSRQEVSSVTGVLQADCFT